MPLQINTPGDFAVALCQQLGAPVTQSNLQFLIAWEKEEGGNWNNAARYNPLNTTMGAPGATSMNSVGVKAYTSWDQGLASTVAALRNGLYNDILADLRAGNAAQTAVNAAGLRTWSGGGYGSIARSIPGAAGEAQQALANAGGVGSPATGPLQTAMPTASAIMDPADLTDFARMLDQRADAINTLAERLSRQLGGASWAGPSAEAFRNEADQFAPVLPSDADSLRGAASDLRRLADALQQELANLRVIEDNARAWFALHPSASSSLSPPWPETDLPATGDPRWRDVQRAFATAGIAI
jgi:uncharacterized protein YukE